ncbi:hypothetical protein [Pseudoalteromonas sp. GB56]
MDRDLTLLEAMRAAIETIKAQSPQEYVENVRAHSESPIAISLEDISGDYRGVKLQDGYCSSFNIMISYSSKKDEARASKYFAEAYKKAYEFGAAHRAALLGPSDYTQLNAIAA